MKDPLFNTLPLWPELDFRGPSIPAWHSSSSGFALAVVSSSGRDEVETPLILGYIEVGPNFPVEPGQTVTPGKVEAKGEAIIVVQSLRSVEKDGKPYDPKMDDKMYHMMSYTNYPKIVYRINGLAVKEVPKSKGEPYLFDSKGELAIAGVTNTISMPVKVQLLDGGKVKISGSITIKMTDYKIEPANILVAKTGNDVKVIFEWVLGQKKPTAAAK